MTVAKKKARTAEYGTSYNVKSGVTAIDKITKKSLTKNITYTTTKGQGVQFMMDRPTAWHMGGFDDVTLKQAQEEIAEYTARKLSEVK